MGICKDMKGDKGRECDLASFSLAEAVRKSCFSVGCTEKRGR